MKEYKVEIVAVTHIEADSEEEAIEKFHSEYQDIYYIKGTEKVVDLEWMEHVKEETNKLTM